MENQEDLEEPEEKQNPYTPERIITGGDIYDRIKYIRGFGDDYKHNYAGKFLNQFVAIDWDSVKMVKLPVSDLSFYSIIKMREFDRALTGIFINAIIRRLFCEKLGIVFTDLHLTGRIERNKFDKIMFKKLPIKQIKNTAKYKTNSLANELIKYTNFYRQLRHFKTALDETGKIVKWMESRPITHLFDDFKKVVDGFKNITVSNFKHAYSLSYKFDPVYLNRIKSAYRYLVNEDTMKITELGVCDLIIGDMLIDIKVTQHLSDEDKLNLAIQAALFNATSIKKINRIGIMSILEKQLYIWNIRDWSKNDQKKLLHVFFLENDVNVDTGVIRSFRYYGYVDDQI